MNSLKLHDGAGDDLHAFAWVRGSGELVAALNTDAEVWLSRGQVVELIDWLQEWLDEGEDTEDAEDPAVEAWRGSVLHDAQDAVYGDRETTYGHPRENFVRTGALWSALLHDKLTDGAYVDAEDVGRLMIAAKLARDVESPKRDNRVDIAGYALTLDRLETGR